MAGSMLIYWRVYLHMWWIQLILKSHVITHKIPFHSYKEWLDICSVASDPWPMMMSSVIRWFQRRGWDPSVFHQQTGVQHMFGSIFVNYIRLYNRFFLNCSSPFFACFFPEFLLMCRRLCRARCVGCGRLWHGSVVHSIIFLTPGRFLETIKVFRWNLEAIASSHVFAMLGQTQPVDILIYIYSYKYIYIYIYFCMVIYIYSYIL